MLVYIFINIIILFFSIVFLFKKHDNYNKKIAKLYLCIIGLILVFIAGFRGAFTSDYIGYTNLFHYYNSFGLLEIFHTNFSQEIGYIVLNKIIGFFTENSIFLMLTTSTIIIILFFNEILMNSDYIWLSVLMFVTVGSYYTSFNLIRQVIAVSIVFFGSKYLYQRNIKRYLMVIIVASLFHKSALIMIIFYFILNYKFKIKKLVMVLFTLVVTLFFLDNILSVVLKYVYKYYDLENYVMVGFNYKNVVLPIAILVFSILNYFIVDINNEKVNIWINAAIFYAFFSILGLKVQLIQRIAEYFAPYTILLVPYIIKNIKAKNIKIMYIFIFIIAMFLYNYMSLNGTAYNPYYFIW